MQKFIVVYPKAGALGAIAAAAYSGKCLSQEAAETLRREVAAQGATDRARFDLAIVIPAYRSVGVWTAFVDRQHVPDAWKVSSAHLAALAA